MKTVDIIGAGLAGTEAALQLADRGVRVRLFEMRPAVGTPVHTGAGCAELVCSNSFKSMKPESAAGMLKHELSLLGSRLYACALASKVDAGGALAVDREAFSRRATQHVDAHPNIERIVGEVREPDYERAPDAVIIASGPLTSDALAQWISGIAGADNLAFFDAAAPIVAADSLDESILFRQSRYEKDAPGDYLNAPFSRDSYEAFIDALVSAQRVIMKEFETKDLFQACQPIEEIARKGIDPPRFGPVKPVGLADPATGKRPWAAVEIMDGGMLSHLYQMSPNDAQIAMSEKCGLTTAQLGSWLKSLNVVRNLSAHHARMYNRVYDIKPKLPQNKKWQPIENNKKHIFGFMTMIEVLISDFNLEHDETLESILQNFPQAF